MGFKLIAPLAALGMALAGGAAAAPATVVAELTQVHIRLIDLDLTDGITPAISFDDATPLRYFAIAAPFDFLTSIVSGQAALEEALSGQALGSDLTTKLLMGITAGDLFTAGAGPSFTVSGTALLGGSISGGPAFSTAATLSPNTRMILTAVPGSVALDHLTRDGQVYASVGHCPLDAAGAALCSDPQTAWASAYESRQSSIDGSHPSLLSVTWDNLGASEDRKWINAGIYAYLAPVTDPVPEPATLLMFLAGLLGLAAHRRSPRLNG
ncbi:PEP-CTERM sorting domain-containing protein [Roseateles sp. LYH14W]|uniref:PEP-CTERM sorting domain-containing protein n=1 Tax=Pelomonas parva TaxID=3299032 RepID=A0ABW7FE47_9BURK